jgi:histidinol-phosphate aminotransferase
MSKFWSATARGLTPYVPGEQPKLANLVKLNTNESPYPPSPKALAAMRDVVGEALRLYPDPQSDRLRDAIARLHGVAPNQVFVGNGSDEVLAHAFLGLLKHDAPLLYPDITYSFYPVYCGLYGIESVEIPLAEDFSIRVDDYARAELNVNGGVSGGVIFPNPNAPTGRLLPLADIERLLQQDPDRVVVIDEAYIDFGGDSAIALIARFPNLLVTRTLSKSHALAGLRVGYAVGHADLIEALVRVKDSFNSYPLDRFAQAGAQASIEDADYVAGICAQVVATREKLVADLQRLGFDVLPSGANFVFAKHATRDGADLAAALRERSIIVRHFKKPARIDPYLRITVGTDAQCAALVAALRSILA